MWGFSGARSHTYEKEQTNRLVTLAALRALSFGDVPYFLSGDFNIQWDELPVFQQMVRSGKFINVVQAANQGRASPPTFRRKGTEPAKLGEGLSSLDMVIANQQGASMVRGVSYLCELATQLETQHIAVAVDLDLEAFNVTQSLWVRPIPFPVDKLTPNLVHPVWLL